MYNGIDKSQLFAQIKDMYQKGENSTLSNAEINELEKVTGKKYSEVVIENELVWEYFEPSSSVSDFQTTTAIKVLIEEKSNQKISVKKLGMALVNAGFERVKRNGIYGYMVKNKIYKNEIEPQEVLPF